MVSFQQEVGPVGNDLRAAFEAEDPDAAVRPMLLPRPADSRGFPRVSCWLPIGVASLLLAWVIVCLWDTTPEPPDGGVAESLSPSTGDESFDVEAPISPDEVGLPSKPEDLQEAPPATEKSNEESVPVESPFKDGMIFEGVVEGIFGFKELTPVNLTFVGPHKARLMRGGKLVATTAAFGVDVSEKIGHTFVSLATQAASDSDDAVAKASGIFHTAGAVTNTVASANGAWLMLKFTNSKDKLIGQEFLFSEAQPKTETRVEEVIPQDHDGRTWQKFEAQDEYTGSVSCTANGKDRELPITLHFYNNFAGDIAGTLWVHKGSQEEGKEAVAFRMAVAQDEKTGSWTLQTGDAVDGLEGKGKAGYVMKVTLKGESPRQGSTAANTFQGNAEVKAKEGVLECTRVKIVRTSSDTLPSGLKGLTEMEALKRLEGRRFLGTGHCDAEFVLKLEFSAKGDATLSKLEEKEGAKIQEVKIEAEYDEARGVINIVVRENQEKFGFSKLVCGLAEKVGDIPMALSGMVVPQDGKPCKIGRQFFLSGMNATGEEDVVGIEQQQTALETNPLTVGDVLVGSYTCTQPILLKMVVTDKTEKGEVTVDFRFGYVGRFDHSMHQGTYAMNGTLQDDGTLKLVKQHWHQHPGGSWRMVDVSGKIVSTQAGLLYKGKVEDDDCQGFSVSRVSHNSLLPTVFKGEENLPVRKDAGFGGFFECNGRYSVVFRFAETDNPEKVNVRVGIYSLKKQEISLDLKDAEGKWDSKTGLLSMTSTQNVDGDAVADEDKWTFQGGFSCNDAGLTFTGTFSNKNKCTYGNHFFANEGPTPFIFVGLNWGVIDTKQDEDYALLEKHFDYLLKPGKVFRGHLVCHTTWRLQMTILQKEAFQADKDSKAVPRWRARVDYAPAAVYDGEENVTHAGHFEVLGMFEKITAQPDSDPLLRALDKLIDFGRQHIFREQHTLALNFYPVVDKQGQLVGAVQDPGGAVYNAFGAFTMRGYVWHQSDPKASGAPEHWNFRGVAEMGPNVCPTKHGKTSTVAHFALEPSRKQSRAAKKTCPIKQGQAIKRVQAAY